MYTIADGGGGLTADDISIEQQRVTDINTTLKDALARVHEGARMGRVPSQAYGEADLALELEVHAGKAHGRVVTDMERTITGLESYERALAGFVEQVAEQDVEQAQRFTAIAQGVSCISQPTFEENGQCVAPTGGDQ